jgi:hypothetical protein
MQTAKGIKKHIIDMKMFKTLKDIGVELSLYHGGPLNGKDIKKANEQCRLLFR